MKAKMVYVAVALALVFSLTAVIMPANPAQAVLVTVTNTNDSGAGSLRSVIGNATDGDDIEFTVAGTITLASQITINKSLTITGPGAAILAISGNNTSRVFQINGSYTVSMLGLTIRNGNATGVVGGGLYNTGGNVTLTNCTISGNTAGDNGGGIFNDNGDVTLTNCTISDNYAGDGGGIFNDFHVSGSIVTLTNCTISGNTATGDGGGICNYDTVNMTNCTVSGNTAAVNGGGIFNDGELMLTNCTVSGNEATSVGGGIYTDSPTTLTCTIVYGNTPDNTEGGYDDTGCSIVDSPDPLLGLLGDNGGPTFTHALLAGSPAIDTCDCDCSVVTDQRGLPRPVDGDLDGTAVCDVGAYEYQQQPVGGTIEPVDRLSLLAPWLGLAALIVVAITIAVVVRRRMA